MNISATHRLATMIVAAFSIAAPLLVPAAEAASPPQYDCVNCIKDPGHSYLVLPDLYLSTMYQQDAAGNPLASATAGQTVVYPIVVGNKGPVNAATNVSVWWTADQTNGLSDGWIFDSASTDSGFFCHEPGASYIGEQVYCEGGTIAAGQVAHITIRMRAPWTPGAHQISLDIDPLGAIAESNETNTHACCLMLGT